MDEHIAWQVINAVQDSIGPEAAEKLRRLMKTHDRLAVLGDAAEILEAAGAPLSPEVADAVAEALRRR